LLERDSIPSERVYGEFASKLVYARGIVVFGAAFGAKMAIVTAGANGLPVGLWWKVEYVALDLPSCTLLGVEGRVDFLPSSAPEWSGCKSHRD
jgi:hypothetical protein